VGAAEMIIDDDGAVVVTWRSLILSQLLSIPVQHWACYSCTRVCYRAA